MQQINYQNKSLESISADLHVFLTHMHKISYNIFFMVLPFFFFKGFFLPQNKNNFVIVVFREALIYFIALISRYMLGHIFCQKNGFLFLTQNVSFVMDLIFSTNHFP